MTGLAGFTLFLAFIAIAVVNPSLAAVCGLLALAVFAFWPVDVSK